MAEESHPVSEISPPGRHVGSTQAQIEDEHEPPIISLSKSSIDMVGGSPQRMELAGQRKDLRKSASGAVGPKRPVSVGGPVTGTPLLCDSERSSICSADSTPDTVIWRGGTTRPWSVTEESPCARRTHTHDLLLGQHGTPTEERCEAPSPSAQRLDLREGREGHCGGMANPAGCACSRMICEVQPCDIGQPYLANKHCIGTEHGGFLPQGVNVEACGQSALRAEIQQFGFGCRTACPGPGGSLRNPCSLATCPSHVLAQPACVGGTCSAQRLHPALLGFPPLVSSISESGLNNRGGGHCCSPHLGGRVDGSSLRLIQANQPGQCQRTVREASTMTSNLDVRDVGVQVGFSDSLDTPRSHVFPEVNLAEKVDSETDLAGADAGSGVGRRSPVKEVEWDAEGMTWEVYGAAVDPEELGLAIQRHLELQIKETAAAAAAQKASVESSDGSLKKSRRRRKSVGVMSLLRGPACCSRSSTSAD